MVRQKDWGAVERKSFTKGQHVKGSLHTPEVRGEAAGGVLPPGNASVFSQSNSHLPQYEDQHFTLDLQGCARFYARTHLFGYREVPYTLPPCQIIFPYRCPTPHGGRMLGFGCCARLPSDFPVRIRTPFNHPIPVPNFSPVSTFPQPSAGTPARGPLRLTVSPSVLRAVRPAILALDRLNAKG